MISVLKGSVCVQVLWNVTGSLIVYPCHAVIVAMQANNGQQKFFVGHTDKVRIIYSAWRKTWSNET